MNKKGLSLIITTLIIIILVFVAITIVWFVIKNVVSEGSEDISLGMIMIDLEIQNVKVEYQDIQINVKRYSGKGDFTGIKFIISDGKNSKIISRETSLKELEQETFAFNSTELEEISLIKKVSIAPFLKPESKKEKTGNIVDEFEFSTKDIIKNLGGISWWRFEGNAKDEIGNNHGNIEGSDCNVYGKYEKACEFDGNDDYIDCGNDSSLEMNQFHSIGFWINITNTDSGWNRILAKTSQTSDRVPGIWTNPQKTCLYWRYDPANQGAGCVAYEGDDTDFEFNKWYYILGVKEGTTLKMYINGEQKGSYLVPDIIDQGTGNFYFGSDTNPFYGIIDEVVIFNRSLSENTVKGLYELDFSK